MIIDASSRKLYKIDVPKIIRFYNMLSLLRDKSVVLAFFIDPIRELLWNRYYNATSSREEIK